MKPGLCQTRGEREEEEEEMEEEEEEVYSRLTQRGRRGPGRAEKVPKQACVDWREARRKRAKASHTQLHILK